LTWYLLLAAAGLVITTDPGEACRALRAPGKEPARVVEVTVTMTTCGCPASAPFCTIACGDNRPQLSARLVKSCAYAEGHAVTSVPQPVISWEPGRWVFDQ